MAQKKFVDAEGLKHFAQVLNNYPDNEIISTVIDAIGEELENKVTGPNSSTNAHIATFTGTTGKVIQDSGFTIAKSVPADAQFTDTIYENKAAISGGTDVSLVTTGDKYNWDNKANKI